MTDRSLYRNLFSYVPTESRRPLENFLTEALADLMNRLLEKDDEVRKATKAFIMQELRTDKGCQEFDARLDSADRLAFRTQQQIWLNAKPKRLDLCLYADNDLVLVIENKVAETRGKADLSADDTATAKKVAEQLGSYARWLKANWPSAGLVLLGIDEGPVDFVTNAKKYPAHFRSVWHWARVWQWLEELARGKDLNPESAVFVAEFARFLEEMNLSDINQKELDLLADCITPVQRFLVEIEGKVTELLKEIRPFAQRTLPQPRKEEGRKKLPAGNVRGAEYHAVGDFAYCYDRGARNYDLMRLKWFVGWGFQAPDTGRGKRGPLQAFVSVESDYDGTLIPLPSGKERTELKEKGWQFDGEFDGEIKDEDGKYSSFSKVCDPADFLRGGFRRSSETWFKNGIKEAARILRAAKKALKT